MVGGAGWTSWALSRLHLTPSELTSRVCAVLALPDDPEARELVELHLAALDAAVDLGLPDLLVPQLRWERSRWPVVVGGPPATVWPGVERILDGLLDQVTATTVRRLVTAAQRATERDESRSLARHGRVGLAGLSTQSRAFLRLALEGRQDDAVALVLDLLETGTPSGDVLLEVIAPAQHEVGRLWERGVVGVAQEHVATAVSQTAMAALHPRLDARSRVPRTAVAACVPGDTHELGLRMVTDVLRLRGWATVYVGASCPTDSLIDQVAACRADVLLLGASMPAHLTSLRRSIEQVRADPRCDGLVVVVGGAPVEQAPEVGAWAGADAAVRSAVEAVEAADRLAGVRGSLEPI